MVNEEEKLASRKIHGHQTDQIVTIRSGKRRRLYRSQPGLTCNSCNRDLGSDLYTRSSTSLPLCRNCQPFENIANKEATMATPKGMKHFHRRLATGGSVLIYSNRERIVLQLRHETPTEENLLAPSFKVAVELSPADALLIASELMIAVVPCFTTSEDANVFKEEEPRET